MLNVSSANSISLNHMLNEAAQTVANKPLNESAKAVEQNIQVNALEKLIFK